MSASSRTFAPCVCVFCFPSICVLSFFAVWLFFFSFLLPSFAGCTHFSHVRMCVCVSACMFPITVFADRFSYDSDRNCFGACSSCMNYVHTKRCRLRLCWWRPSVYLNIVCTQRERNSGRKAKDIRLATKFSPQCMCPHTPLAHPRINECGAK